MSPVNAYNQKFKNNSYVRILILGGTWDANCLAKELHKDNRFHIITSLAGYTQHPVKPDGIVHVGGFGGVHGLKTFLSNHKIDVIVNATHPFSERISQNAITAAHEAQCLYYRLYRPPWMPTKNDIWFDAKNATDAARKLRPDSVVYLTVGKQQLAPFIERQDVHYIVRMIEIPADRLPEKITVIRERPPFSTLHERQNLISYRVDTLVTKNSGGQIVNSKLTAARELRIPVILIRRPCNQQKETVSSVKEMVALLTVPS